MRPGGNLAKATSGVSSQKCSEAWTPRSDASGSKRFHGWTKRRFLPFGSDFCELTPEVATHCQGMALMRRLLLLESKTALVSQRRDAITCLLHAIEIDLGVNYPGLGATIGEDFSPGIDNQ